IDRITQINAGAAAPRALDASCRLQAECRCQLKFLEQEGRDAFRTSRRVEEAIDRLVDAKSMKAPVAPMHADGSAQFAKSRMHCLVLHLETRLVLAIRKARTNDVVTLILIEHDLVVAVACRAEPIADRLDAVVVHAPLAARLDLLLIEIDARALLFRSLARNAVQAAEARVGNADEPTLADNRGAQRITGAVDERVGLAAARCIVVIGLP